MYRVCLTCRIYINLLLSLQRAHQTSTKMATFWSSGSLVQTPTTQGSPHVKPPSIAPSLASTAAVAAACLSSAGPCPSLSSCLYRAGPGWPPDPPPQCLVPVPTPVSERQSFRFSFGGILSLSVSETALTGGGLWLLCVLVGSLLLCLLLSLYPLLCGALCCNRWPVENSTKKIDVQKLKWQEKWAVTGTCCKLAHNLWGTPSAFGGCVLRELAACFHWLPLLKCSCTFLFL